MIRCPGCKSAGRSRRPRTSWMRATPTLLLFQCDDCGTEYCNLLWLWSFRRPTILFALVFVLVVLIGVLIWQVVSGTI